MTYNLHFHHSGDKFHSILFHGNVELACEKLNNKLNEYQHLGADMTSSSNFGHVVRFSDGTTIRLWIEAQQYAIFFIDLVTKFEIKIAADIDKAALQRKLIRLSASAHGFGQRLSDDRIELQNEDGVAFEAYEIREL